MADQFYQYKRLNNMQSRVLFRIKSILHKISMHTRPMPCIFLLGLQNNLKKLRQYVSKNLLAFVVMVMCQLKVWCATGG